MNIKDYGTPFVAGIPGLFLSNCQPRQIFKVLMGDHRANGDALEKFSAEWARMNNLWCSGWQIIRKNAVSISFKRDLVSGNQRFRISFVNEIRPDAALANERRFLFAHESAAYWKTIRDIVAPLIPHVTPGNHPHIINIPDLVQAMGRNEPYYLPGLGAVKARLVISPGHRYVDFVTDDASSEATKVENEKNIQIRQLGPLPGSGDDPML